MEWRSQLISKVGEFPARILWSSVCRQTTGEAHCVYIHTDTQTHTNTHSLVLGRGSLHLHSECREGCRGPEAVSALEASFPWV